MPSTYSPNLRIELIASGEQANTWGITTNNNLGTLIGEAIAGLVDIDVTAANATLTALNGLTDQARNMMITVSGTPGAARSVFCPDGDSKVYVVANDSDDVVTFATVSGSGVDIPVGTSKFVYCDGIDVYEAVTAIDTLLLGGAPTTSLEAANKGYVDAAIAAINYTANRAVVTNGSGNLAASAATATEVSYLSGVTSAIQTQLNAKQATITGAATTITSSDLTASRAVVSNASGKVAVSSVTATEIGYVSGVTSAIQTQLNAKQPTVTVNGIVKGNGSGTLSAAAAGTDYAPATSGTSILYGNGAGGFSSVTVGSGLSFAGGTLSNSSTSPIPSGTRMLFVQSAAPTGWTQITSYNNYALRVVSGTGGGTGGSVGFTSAFASQAVSGSVSVSGTVGGTTLTTAQIPSHNHSVTVYGLTISAPTGGSNGAISTINPSDTTGSTGGGGSHDHSFSGSGSFSGTAINMAVQYVDTIICSKD